MRRLACLLGGAVLASTAVIITGGSPALAECPAKKGAEGSLPTTKQKVYMVDQTAAASGRVFYVDDRDYMDDDDADGYAGGIWLYEETNGKGWLQTGGTQWYFEDIPVEMPYVPPQTVSVPGQGPVPPTSRTLFPNGFGGGSLGETAGGYDDCYHKDNRGKIIPPDTVWF